jgi:hypothetical protein
LLAKPKKEAAPVDLSRYTIDPLATLIGEIEYSRRLALDAFPNDNEMEREHRAHQWRFRAWQCGRWLTAAELHDMDEAENEKLRLDRENSRKAWRQVEDVAEKLRKQMEANLATQHAEQARQGAERTAGVLAALAG